MGSQLTSAKSLLAKGVFDDLTSFAQLEERISALGAENTKTLGDAFEMFIEGFLATQEKFLVEEHWVVGNVPARVLDEQNLPKHATLGIDGVFRTRTGALVPYQVKFRTGRPTLAYGAVSEFLGVTERATDRVIFTNSNKIAVAAETRDALRSVRGADFDELTPEDFDAISAWLREKPVVRRKIKPRRHQREGLEQISATLADHDRATAVMACGTGKTLLALWVAEQLQPKTVLVLVPSLTLVQQTLEEWSRHNSWGKRFSYICVCSDKSVARSDAIDLHNVDVDFPVSTDPVQVRAFLKGDGSTDERVKVVFSTYQSSKIVSEGAYGLPPFDFGIFDEAHKTTGAKGGLFAHSLSDENIGIAKRLFLTATPRHYDIRGRDSEGEFKVISMDDESVYGPRAYTLTFGEAAKRGIICDYKVVISVVSGADIDNFSLKHGITLVERDEIGSQWVANQLAMERAIELVSAQRVITFHSRVSMAQDFASDTTRGVGQFLDGFSLFHVNGKQNSSERKQLIKDFREAPKAIITNARCLTEGIDIPAVDMVAFIDPRRSKVDIAQAAGRAMRKPYKSDKTTGYVVVPLFLEMEADESLEEALERSNFSDVAAVLNAMREQDEDLVEIIAALQMTKGHGEVFNPKVLQDKVEVLGPVVTFEDLERSIFAQIVETLGESWDEWYGLLRNYVEKFGSARVPIDCTYKAKKLGTWCDTQRTNYKKGLLPAARLRKLDDLSSYGWAWSLKDSQREYNIQRLRQYFEEFGHTKVKDTEICADGFTIGNAVRGLRVAYKSGTLEEKWVEYLEKELKLKWDPDRYAFICKYAALRRRFRHNSSYPHSSEKIEIPHGPGLTETLSMKTAYDNLRTSYQYWKGKNQYNRKAPKPLSDREIKMLEEIPNWRWSFDDSDERLSEFKSAVTFILSKGRDLSEIKARESVDGYPLGRNLSKLRSRIKRGKTTGSDEDYIAWLSEKGCDLRPPFDRSWQEKYDLLVAYVKENGSASVPQDETYRGVTLGRWVSTQRSTYKEGRMHPTRVAALERLKAQGWVWDASESSASAISKTGISPAKRRKEANKRPEANDS